ncbi:MAG: hypothetical protein ABI878_16330 [Acidobacteriota bacterium]
MQPKLFEKPAETVDLETVILYALGDFQSRGKVLANRELAFDRLRGAFLRACAKFGIPEPPNNQIVEKLKHLGAAVTEIPKFVAKRPFRITIDTKTASDANNLFREIRTR